MGRLKVDLIFEQNTKVVDFDVIYNFHGENFFKIQTDFKVKIDF